MIFLKKSENDFRDESLSFFPKNYNYNLSRNLVKFLQKIKKIS